MTLITGSTHPHPFVIVSAKPSAKNWKPGKERTWVYQVCQNLASNFDLWNFWNLNNFLSLYHHTSSFMKCILGELFLNYKRPRKRSACQKLFINKWVCCPQPSKLICHGFSKTARTRQNLSCPLLLIIKTFEQSFEKEAVILQCKRLIEKGFAVDQTRYLLCIYKC